jgi:hypothetical protein
MESDVNGSELSALSNAASSLALPEFDEADRPPKPLLRSSLLLSIRLAMAGNAERTGSGAVQRESERDRERERDNG